MLWNGEKTRAKERWSVVVLFEILKWRGYVCHWNVSPQMPRITALDWSTQPTFNRFSFILSRENATTRCSVGPCIRLIVLQSGVPICNTLFYGDITLGQHGATNLMALAVFLFHISLIFRFFFKTPVLPLICISL